uniref:Uncharacterized protein n=1 Tax=Lepeophtheirus salmonis TaxID=72036 RepID=A0A0K2UTN2_LEPSM
MARIFVRLETFQTKLLFIRRGINNKLYSCPYENGA